MDGEEVLVCRTVTMKPIGRVALAEAIALFSTLYPKFSKSLTLNPGPTTTTTRLSLPETPAKFPYKLPFAAEQQLCTLLANISRTTATSGAITAVCVQETNRGSLLVRIAINQKKSAICRSKLDYIAAGFGNLFAALGRVGGKTVESSSSVDAPIDHVLSATVSMCRERILDVTKLRTDRLQDSTSLEAVISHFEKTSDHRSLVSPSRAVLRALQEWTAEPSDTTLASLITAAGCWVRTGNLLGVFTTMPTVVVEHSAAMSLLTKLATLARYEADVRSLVAMARTHDAVKHLEAAPLYGGFPEQCPVGPSDYTPNLAETLARICDKHRVDCVDTSSLARHLERPPEDLQQIFADHTTRQLNRGVMHAEAQLVSHFESVVKDKSAFRPPRVICASIQPCAFCRALVSLQNKLWMGPTDGKICVDWALSDESLGSSDGIGSRLVDELEGWVMAVLCDLGDETKRRKARDGEKPGAAEKMRVTQKTQPAEKTPQVAEKTQAAKITQATTETQAVGKSRQELEQRESGLDKRIAQLEKRDAKMQERGLELQKRELEIRESEAKLQKREEELHTRELKMENVEKNIEKREMQAENRKAKLQTGETNLQNMEEKLRKREQEARNRKGNLQKKELGLRTRQTELWTKQVEQKMRESP